MWTAIASPAFSIRLIVNAVHPEGTVPTSTSASSMADRDQFDTPHRLPPHPNARQSRLADTSPGEGYPSARLVTGYAYRLCHPAILMTWSVRAG